MAYQRLAYDDAASTPEMAADCARVGDELRLPAPREAAAFRTGTTGPPAGTTTLDVTPALAELAARLELHLD